MQLLIQKLSHVIKYNNKNVNTGKEKEIEPNY